MQSTCRSAAAGSPPALGYCDEAVAEGSNDHPAMRTPSLLKPLNALSVRASLAVLVVGCILPLALVGAYFFFSFYEREEAQLITNSLTRTRAMSAAVDHDFATTQAALLALATSAHLARGDLAGFHRQALEELRHLPAEHIVLIDPTGQILLTTRRPFGTQLPRLTSSPLLARRGAGQSDLGAVRAPSPAEERAAPVGVLPHAAAGSAGRRGTGREHRDKNGDTAGGIDQISERRGGRLS